MKDLCNLLNIIKTYLKLQKVYSVLSAASSLSFKTLEALKKSGILKHYVIKNKKIIAFINNSSYLPFLSLVNISKPSKLIFINRRNIKLNFLNKIVISTDKDVKIFKHNSDKKFKQGGLLLFYL